MTESAVAQHCVGVTQKRNHKLRWIIYVSLILFRFIGVFQRGYIHPDEFFQGGQELFFGIDVRNADHFDSVGGKNDDYLVRNVPWEFEPKHAVRSIVPPSFMTLLPLRLYVSVRDQWMGIHNDDDDDDDDATVSTEDERLNNDTSVKKSWIDSYWKWMAPDRMNLSGREILFVPRLFMALLSVVFLDGSLWILTNLRQRRWEKRAQGGISSIYGPPVEVIVIASSWPCLAFGVRPFTNSLEAMVLAFLLVIVAMNEIPDSNFPPKRDKQISGTNELVYGNVTSLLLIGATCSVGVFVRFTFIFFAFPVVTLYLLKRWMRRNGIWYKLINIAHDGTWLALSFLLVSCVFIVVDTHYYSRGAYTACTNFGCMLNYIAPLNAFWYNSNPSNLAQHGLHPRLTHIGVNLPMLFGPLALVFYGSTIRNICDGAVAINSGTSCLDSKATSRCTIAFGLILLSCAPHQEPRFLLPLIVPLVYLFGQNVVGRSRLFRTVWIVFNLACYMFFAWLHQGGLVQSILQFEDMINTRNGSAPRHHKFRVFIYYKTYMPPSFLAQRILRRREESCKVESTTKTCMRDVGEGTDAILDLKGADSTVLLALLREWLSCPSKESDVSEENVDEHFVSTDNTAVYLISPQAALLPIVEIQNEAIVLENYSILLIRDYYGHISTEDWPCYEGSVFDFLDQLKLGIYAVSCTQ